MFKFGGFPIGARLGFLLVAAVIPLATLSAIYAWIAGETAREAELRARYETARVVAGAVESVVEGAGRATDLTLAYDGIGTDPQQCGTALTRLVTLVGTVADASVIVGGRRVCGLMRNDAGITDLQGGIPVVEPRADAVVAIGAGNAPAIRVVRTARDGQAIGVVHVGLTPIWQRLSSSIAGLGRSRVFILTEAGGVIADPDGLVETSAISAVIGAVATTRGGELPVVQIDAPGGGFVAIARVGLTSLRIAVTSDAFGVGRSLGAQIALVIALPLLFLIAAVAIAWLGVDRLVNRWVRRLAKATKTYGEGHLSVRVGPMPHASEEFRALGDSFDAMATRIEARSVDLERALAEKDHFVRELHHRVKNNFQMIASLLTLQRREADRETEAAIREAHDRVQALAAAYRASYADGETGSVPVAPMIVDLVERLRESSHLPARVVVFEGLADGMSLHLDRAIPFALLLTELLVPLLDRIAADEEEAISLVAGWSEADPDIINTRITAILKHRGTPKPLADRLARAYAAQLGATVTKTGGLIDIALPRAL